MINLKNFSAYESAILTFTASAANQNTAWANKINGDSDLRVYNGTTKVAYVQWGNGAQTATSASPNWVAPGEDVIFNMDQADNVAVCLDSSDTGKVYIAHGTGN